MNSITKLAVVIMAPLLLINCVAVNTFPTVARGGDTITLAVGSPDNMTKANTTAEFVSDLDGVSVPLDIRAILKIRPDNTSKIALFDGFAVGNIEYYSSHSAWLSVIVVDLPPGLSLGPGEINITTTATYPSVFTGINSRPIGVEIIEGQGTSNPLNYYTELFPGGTSPGNLTDLEPLRQVVIRPPLIDAWYGAPTYGAAEIVVHVPMQKVGGGAILADSLRVVQDDMFYRNTLGQTNLIWKRTGDDVTVYITSPGGKMSFLETRFSVVLRAGNEFITSPGPSISSVTYYNSNGDVVTANTPTVSDFTVAIDN